MKDDMVCKEMTFAYLLNENRKGIIRSICHKYPILSWEDGEDIFQEGSYELWKKWKERDATWKSKEFSNLLYIICRNIGGHYIRKVKNMAKLDDGRFVAAEEHDGEEKENRLSLLDDVLEKMNEKERSLVRMFYYDDTNLHRIAESMGYKNEKVAKNMKCKAMKKLKEAYRIGMEERRQTRSETIGSLTFKQESLLCGNNISMQAA